MSQTSQPQAAHPNNPTTLEQSGPRQSGLPQPQTSDNTDLKSPSKRWRDILFDIRVSRRYHTYRTRFFERLETIHIILSLFLGFAAGFTLFGDAVDLIAALLAFTVGVLAIFRLGIGFSRKSKQHEDLRQAFGELEAETIRAEERPDLITDLEAKRVEVEVRYKELPIKHALQAKAWNEQSRADGKHERLNIPRHYKVLAQFVAGNPERIRPKEL